MTDHEEELLSELLLEWEELYERGQDTAPGELCKACPLLAHELASRIASLKKTMWLKDPEPPPDSPTDPLPQLSGKVLGGRYRLEELIATGGFSEVWRAFDSELLRIVAVKVPRRSRLNSTASFVAEARRVARLKHPSIVPVHDVGAQDDRCFIVTEYVEGGSLAQRLTRNPPSAEQSIGWIKDIAHALEYAHVHGVIHRDIKPANILIDHHGRALLGDFGIAQSAKKTGTFAPSLGTLSYMSPEQLEGKPATPQSDVYSLGVVLHECLTGKLPYSSHNPTILRNEILGGAKRVSPGIPKPILEICRKAMSRQPQDRHLSAAHFAAELDRATGGNRQKTRSSPRGILLSALAVCLVLGSVAGGLWLLGDRKRSEKVSGTIGASVGTVAESVGHPIGKPADLHTIADEPFADVLLIAKQPLEVLDLQEGAKVSAGSTPGSFESIPEDLAGLRYSVRPAFPIVVTGVQFKTAGKVVVGVDWFSRSGFYETKWACHITTEATRRNETCSGLELWEVVGEAGKTVPIPASCVVIGRSIETTVLSGSGLASPVSKDMPFANVRVENSNPMQLGTVGDSAFVKGDIPSDLSDLCYAHGGDWSHPVVVTFTSPGRIAYLAAWSGGNPDVTRFDDDVMGFFAVRRESERVGLFDIWDIAGKPGDRFVLPDWGSVVANEIEFHGTTLKRDAAGSQPTAAETAGIQEAKWRQSATPLPTIENSVGMRLVEIAPGESLMTTVRGGIVAVPVVSRVRITRPFLIGQTEVTVGEWQRVMGSTPGDVEQENLPVTNVSWHDAVAFCETLSSLPEEKERGRRYRLPTNAEWEYACRAGTTTPIWFGDDHGLVEEYAWMRQNSAGRNHPVGLKSPSPWGLYDIRGNVHEWVSDWRADSWKPEPVDADGVAIDPQGPDDSPFGKRLVRGGSKLDNPDAFATETEPTNRTDNIGFRVVAVIEANEPDDSPPAPQTE